MKFKLFDRVAVNRDIPEYDLLEGDIGAIVETYSDGKAFEVEFNTKDGFLVALLTMAENDLRVPSAEELRRWPRKGLKAGEHIGSTIAES